MKTITQFLSSAFILGCTQVSMAAADCGSEKCETSSAVALKAVVKSACADKANCEDAALAEGQERVQYLIKGMTCGSCSSAVTTSLKKIAGVTVQKVCHKSGIATIDFDAAKVKKANLIEAINQGDFTITAERVTVPVSGMTCTSCTGKVTKALNAIEGVTVKTVCHKSAKAVVDVVTSKSSRAAVVKAITASGYKVS